MQSVFVTGGTGYLGRGLLAALGAEGYPVTALVRPGSETRLPTHARPVVGSALDAASFAPAIERGATVVHLVGTPHPSPFKAAEFVRVDLASIRATTIAAVEAGARHLVYVSVAHPAPVMRAYIAVRTLCEDIVHSSGIPATILRPWYVLGPGHWWPYALVPLYTVCRWLPATRDAAERLGLVTRPMMIGALVEAVAHPPVTGIRIVDVRAIRRCEPRPHTGQQAPRSSATAHTHPRVSSSHRSES